MHVEQHSREIFSIANFLSPEECRTLITLSETIGYDEAPIMTHRGPRMMKEVRNNTRVLHKDEALARRLYEKALPVLPSAVGHSGICGFNELFRFYRYYPGEHFKRHRDGAFIRSAEESSFFTFMIYLNDACAGGATAFAGFSVRPEVGKALIFLHSVLHEGEAVSEGVKYVLRTDVMYRLPQL